MSYCRWSCMNGACMVYAYESFDGIEIHLAGRKRLHQDKCPVVDFALISTNFEEYKKQYDIRKDWLESEEGQQLVTIDLPHAGESFREKSLKDFRDRLIYLKELGYIFPDYVFDEIKEELNDSN